MGKEKSDAVQKTRRIFPSYSVLAVTLFLASPVVSAALDFHPVRWLPRMAQPLLLHGIEAHSNETQPLNETVASTC